MVVEPNIPFFDDLEIAILNATFDILVQMTRSLYIFTPNFKIKTTF